MSNTVGLVVFRGRMKSICVCIYIYEYLSPKDDQQGRVGRMTLVAGV